MYVSVRLEEEVVANQESGQLSAAVSCRVDVIGGVVDRGRLYDHRLA